MKHKKRKKLYTVILAGVLLTGILFQPLRTVSAAEDSSQSMEDWVQSAREALAEIVREREIMALVYLSDEYPVRVSPSYDSDTVVTVLSGQMVDILDVQVSEDGIWEYVHLEYGEQELYGYVPRTNLACPDERFLEWELEYGLYPATPQVMDATGETVYEDIEQFPESYRSALQVLKQQHPNWTFAVMKTNLDWNTVIYNEMQGAKSLTHKSLPEWAKNGLYDTGNWYYATEEALRLYMDPRNHLTETAIFQFEQLTYNETYHTFEAVKEFLDKTFMESSKNAPGTSMTFATIIWSIGKAADYNVSPFHMAARILQEQGSGTSPLISGTYPGYEGYYNYFNIGATGRNNTEVIVNGLKYAKDNGWEGAYYSILGGTNFISSNYIRKGQYTLYLQKFNVNPHSSYPVYTHQYMQNISAPTTESSSIKKLYQAADSLNSPFVFSIPVYENMPSEPCGIPEYSTDVSLTLPTGCKDTTMWLDGVPCQGQMKDGRLVANAANANVRTAVVYQYDASGVPINMYVWSLRHNGTFYVATAEPQLENLLTYHGFSIRITGKSGIRFKTGISVDLRAKLLSDGVNGYVLKEYGTLVMNNENRSQYPMIMGGEKVLSGLSYGLNSSGELQDVFYENVDGRYRYTSVLVGMPATQYKVEYAFRGYAVLEKNGQKLVIYGPVQARSIYSLAQQLLDRGSYAEESDADIFLKKLISDADALEEKEPEEEPPKGGSE